jgi:hypothetical protein
MPLLLTPLGLPLAPSLKESNPIPCLNSLIKTSEEWQDINGWQGLYAVSNLGRVKSYDREMAAHLTGTAYIHKGRVLTLKKTGNYLGVSLFHDGAGRRFYIHRLVAQAFICNPSNLPEVNHKDGNTFNNYASNLEWVTRSENAQHAWETGLMKSPKPPCGELQHASKLTENDVKQIRIEFQPGSGPRLARKYGVTPRTIYLIARRASWKHVA